MWKDSLERAFQACKGLLNLRTQKVIEEFQQEAEIYFILFLTFVGLSIVTTATLLYLISKMRQFVSLRKCLMTSIESRESRPSPQSLPPINTRPIMRSTNSSNWASPQGPQPQLQVGNTAQSQQQASYPIQTCSQTRGTSHIHPCRAREPRTQTPRSRPETERPPPVQPMLRDKQSLKGVTGSTNSPCGSSRCPTLRLDLPALHHTYIHSSNT